MNIGFGPRSAQLGAELQHLPGPWFPSLPLASVWLYSNTCPREVVVRTLEVIKGHGHVMGRYVITFASLWLAITVGTGPAL